MTTKDMTTNEKTININQDGIQLGLRNGDLDGDYSWLSKFSETTVSGRGVDDTE
jgi:ABC-type taurine transport system substrate-binding protein